MNLVSRSAMDAYYLGVETLLRCTGLDRPRVLALASVLGALRTWVGYIGPRKSRSVFIRHMAHAVPGLPSGELRGLLRAFWYYHQLRFLDLYTVDRLASRDLDACIRYQGLDHLDAVLREKRGAVAVTLHVGDARVAHVALGLRGYPVHLLSARYDDYGARARSARLRSSEKYHQVHFLDEPLRWAHRELAANGVVFVAVSGYGGSRGHTCRFLNSDIVFSSAPSRLSLSTGAPVIPVIDLVDGDGIHHVQLLDRVNAPVCRETRSEMTRDLVRRFEAITVNHLAQLDWIWYVIRCQEQRGEVAAYEEGKMVRSARDAD